MPKPKVQVTLSDSDYDAVRRAADRSGRSLAGVVREAVLQYCVRPEAVERRLRAIEGLAAIEPVPAPTDLEAWKREYAESKCFVGRGEAKRLAPPSAKTRHDSPSEGRNDR